MPPARTVASGMPYLTIERAVKACVSRTKRAQGDIMKSLIGVLALAVVPTLAAAAEKPDWAFPVTEKVQPPPRFEANRVRPAPPGSALSITRAKADDMYDIPNWFPNMYPPMPAIVQYGNKERQVRACGSCQLPTGTGHDESDCVAGLQAFYFISYMVVCTRYCREWS